LFVYNSISAGLSAFDSISYYRHIDIVLSSCGITGIGYLCYRGRSLSWALLVEDSKTLVTVVLFGYLFSPMLHTLTQAISTDTIYTMTFFVLLGNLIFGHYGLDVAMVSKVGNIYDYWC